MARLAVAGVAAAAVLALGALMVTRAVLVGGGCDLDETFSSNARLDMLLATGAAIVGLEIVGFGIFVWRRQRSIEATYRARRRLRPGIDPADPDLTEHIDCAVDAQGCRFDSWGLDQGMLWAVLARVEETADYIFLITATARAYIVPKRDLPPAMILMVRDLARASGKLVGSGAQAATNASRPEPWR